MAFKLGVTWHVQVRPFTSRPHTTLEVDSALYNNNNNNNNSNNNNYNNDNNNNDNNNK